jgi:hypothetical protein
MGYGHGYLKGVVLQEAVVLALLGFVPGMGIAIALYRVSGEATQLPMAMSAGAALAVLALTLAMCVVSGLLALRSAQEGDLSHAEVDFILALSLMEHHAQLSGPRNRGSRKPLDRQKAGTSWNRCTRSPPPTAISVTLKPTRSALSTASSVSRPTHPIAVETGAPEYEAETA